MSRERIAAVIVAGQALAATVRTMVAEARRLGLEAKSLDDLEAALARYDRAVRDAT